MKYHVEFDIELKRNPYKGVFIAVEGIDASGKSTQVKRLKREFKKLGRNAVIRHPFEGDLGRYIRKILAREVKLPTVALQYLITANRQVQQGEIMKDLEKGVDVIIDRYIWSAVVYGIMDKGGVTKEKTTNWLLVEQGILSMYHQFLVPDYTFYLNISPELSIERLSEMDKKKEIYEDSEKIKKIAENYEWVIKRFPKEFIRINAEQPVEGITKEILGRISSIKKKV